MEFNFFRNAFFAAPMARMAKEMGKCWREETAENRKRKASKQPGPYIFHENFDRSDFFRNFADENIYSC